MIQIDKNKLTIEKIKNYYFNNYRLQLIRDIATEFNLNIDHLIEVIDNKNYSIVNTTSKYLPILLKEHNNMLLGTRTNGVHVILKIDNN